MRIFLSIVLASILVAAAPPASAQTRRPTAAHTREQDPKKLHAEAVRLNAAAAATEKLALEQEGLVKKSQDMARDLRAAIAKARAAKDTAEVEKLERQAKDEARKIAARTRQARGLRRLATQQRTEATRVEARAAAAAK